jgi:uncharacterized YigZ family protein
MKGYLTLKKEAENITVIERSKFICNIKPINSEEEALEYINEIKKRHAFATHGCYAYVADELGNLCKFSDAGEPQGTAGLPMLNAIKGKDIKKVACVVTRYFGGIKLGAGGLVRAYGGAVSACLNACELIYMSPASFIEISTEYENYSSLLKIINSTGGVILSTDYDAQIKVTFALNKEDEKAVNVLNQKLLDLFKGKVNSKIVKEDYFSFPVK